MATMARFVHDDEVREFLTTVLATSRRRERKLAKDRILFRAQPGFTWTTEQARTGEQKGEIEISDVEAPHPPERMVPKAEYVGDGRANLKGMPCLYLASTANAAMSEIRPWIGLFITVAQFKMVRDCRLVDCSFSATKIDFLEVVNLDILGEPGEPDDLARDAKVWEDIGSAFSKPVTRDEPYSEYVPTQILARTFHHHGYDGIVYKSLVDDVGLNIALFDLKAAELTGRCLYQTKSASLEFVRMEKGCDGAGFA